MNNTDPSLLAKFNEKIQTKGNNNDPKPLVYITRNKTPITTQRYWEKKLVTSTVGTRSSIAVRRPYGEFMTDGIFVAQVENGDAVVKFAEPNINLSKMTFNHVKTIPNVSELSIMFDGFMKQSSDETVEVYTTGQLPYAFYVDNSNSLQFINLDDEEVSGTISDDAVNVASVRGLYAESIDMDDGIFVFYINSDGELWEARFFGGEVTELTEIILLPEDVTSWVDVWAGITWDYRIVLQLKGSDGNVYTLLSSSRPSGYSLLEYLNVKPIKVFGQFGEEPPNLISVETVGV